MKRSDARSISVTMSVPVLLVCTDVRTRSCPSRNRAPASVASSAASAPSSSGSISATP
jgi:hypothetical protein